MTHDQPQGERDFEMEALLDALGADERSGAPEAMEARVHAEVAANDAIMRRLDALGAAERDLAPASLDERLLDAVGGVFAPASIPIARAVTRVARWAGAAAAVVALGAVAWWGLAPAPPATDTAAALADASDEAADDVELLLDLFADESWSVDLVNLETDADAIGETVGSPWDDLESLAESLNEGAI